MCSMCCFKAWAVQFFHLSLEKGEKKKLHGTDPVKMNIAAIPNVITTCYGAGMEGDDINSLMEIVGMGNIFMKLGGGPHKCTLHHLN